MANKHMKRCSSLFVIRENANQNNNEIPLYRHQDGYNHKDNNKC